MTIGDNIKRIRKEKGITQKQLAEKMGVSQQNLAQYENNKRYPKLETLRRIAAALGVYISDLNPDWSQIPFEEVKEDLLNSSVLFGEKLEISAEYSSRIREQKIIASFRKLNSLGQDKSIDYVEDLATMKKYTDTPE